MADIFLPNIGGEYFPSRHTNVKVPVLIDVDIDLAKAAAEKGAPLANGDVIKAINIPAGTTVLSGYARTVTPTDATALTLTVGYDEVVMATVDATEEANAEATFDFAYVADGSVYEATVSGLTGTATTGVVTIGLLVVDNRGGIRNPIAQLGS